MWTPPDPRTIEGQLRICHNQSAMAVSTLGVTLDLITHCRCADDAKNLLELLNTAQKQVDQARSAALNYAGMAMPCHGSV